MSRKEKYLEGCKNSFQLAGFRVIEGSSYEANHFHGKSLLVHLLVRVVWHRQLYSYLFLISSVTRQFSV